MLLKLQTIKNTLFFTFTLSSSCLFSKTINLKEAMQKSLQYSGVEEIKERKIQGALAKKAQSSQNWQPTLKAELSERKNLNKKTGPAHKIELEQKTPFGLSLKVNNQEKSNQENLSQDLPSYTDKRTNVELSQTVWPLPHKQESWLSWQSADHDLSATRLSSEFEKQAFLKNLNELFWDLFLASKERKIHQDSFTWSQKEWQRGQRNFKKGAIAKSELIELEVNMLKTKENLSSVSSQEKILQAKLAFLIHEKTSDFKLSEEEESSVLYLDKNFDYQKSLRWKAQASEISAADLNLAAQKSKSTAQLSVNALWSRVKDSSSMEDSRIEKSISLNLKYQIPVSQEPANMQAASSSLSLLKVQTHLLGLELQQQFSTWQEQVSHLNELIPMIKNRLKSESEWVKIEEERYTAGTVPFHDLNHAKQSLDKLKLSLQTKKIERNKLLGKVKAEMGLL